MAAEFIRVSARVRPSAKCSSSREVLSLDKTNVAIIASNNRLYQFDQVLDKDADQADVFKDVGKRIIDGALEGINGTVFAYGQTGSGKTHTMLGPAQEDGFFNDANQKGLMPRCLEYLFQQLEQTKAKIGPTFEYTVSCMFVELYNEAITDLLADNCPPVTIRAEAKNIVLQGATCEYATTFLEAMRLLQIGWDNRRVGETAMNKESSRSHAVLTIDVIQTEDHGCVINKREARINLVDLAGSERQSQSKASGVRLKEAAKINQSLGTLGRVIRELSSKGGHVPYRDSKLTLMIRDSLGGSSRTAVIVCVHPDEDYYVESLSTLKFAEDCRLVKNELHFNREVTGKSVAALQEKVLELELQLENASKQTIQQYEDRLRTIKEERDLFKLRLRELENKEVDDTIALYEPKSAFRTPAQKQRRRTRFTTPGQRNHLDATRAAQMPFWGDEEDKENSDLSLDKLLDLIRQLREEIKTLQSGNDESCALASSRLLIIEEIAAAKSILEGEKAALERSFLKEQEENRELQRVNSELDTDLGYAKADITALNDKLSQATNDLESARLRIHELSAERDELTKALSQNAVLIQNKDKEIKEYQGIGKLLAAKNDQNKSLLAEFEKESHRLSDELAKTNTQLADKERLVKLTQDENRRLLKLDQERLSHEKTVEELKASMRDAEQQIYDLRETMDDRDVRIKSLEGACADKEEEIARLKGENECLNTQLAETVGHKNPHQNTRWSKFLKVLGLKKIKMMQKYKDDAAKFRNDIQQLRSEKDRLEKELRRRAT